MNHLDPDAISQMCIRKFGKDMEPFNCLQSITSIENLESNGISSCDMYSIKLPDYRHVMNFTSGCDYYELLYVQFGVPPLMILCFIGNMLNLLIYNLPYFDGSSSVHLLRAKAIFNMIFMFSRILEVLHASSIQPIAWLEPLFWKTRPYVMAISNISGTMSTWLTLMVTIETVMCVTLPFVFRKYCTKKTTWIFLITSLIIATMLHSTIIFVTEIAEVVQVRQLTNFRDDNTSCWFLQSVFRVRNHPEFEILRRSYAIVTTAVSIVIPTIAMLVCTVLISKKFKTKNLGDNFSQRRKCVIRMTVVTTVTHLVLEGPATLTHSAAAIQGEDYSYVMCILNHVNNLGSLINATIPFFVFILYNAQYRHMTVMYIKAVFQMDQVKRKAYFTQAGMRCSRSSRIETDRSMADTRLVSRPSNV